MTDVHPAAEAAPPGAPFHAPTSGVRAGRQAIPVRTPGVAFEGVSKHWFGGNVLRTHIANGVNLLFPAGERFFVRSVRAYLPRIDDPALREQIRGFFGQEGSHAYEHERYFETMEGHGFPVRDFLRIYEYLAYEIIEKAASPALRLSTTAALEHLTALMAEQGLRTRALHEGDEEMRKLLLWHAAEEIEHRSVAYNVLQKCEPGYGLRVAGLVLGTSTLLSFWVAATLFLLAHDGASLREIVFANTTRAESFGQFALGKGIRQYLKRDFHPSQNPVDDLAAEYVREAGLA